MADLERDLKDAGRRLACWRRSISPCAIAAALILVAMMFLGLGFWAFIVFAIGVVIEGVRASASDRVKEHFARKPDLRVETLVDGRSTTEVAASLPPYPFDLERLVANELVVLRRDGRAYARAAEKLAMISPAAMAAFISPMVRQPRKADYDKAWHDYVAKIDTYGDELREWLLDYQRAADQRHRAFDLQLLVVSAPRGAFAERVRVEIMLPVGVEIAGETPTMDMPPAAPEYIAPQPADLNARLHSPRPGVAMDSFLPPWLDRSAESAPRRPTWTVTREGRQVELELGDIHTGRTVEVDCRLLVSVPGVGRFQLGWKLLTKNGLRHKEGALELIVAPPLPRPPLKRLNGILRFPDVPILNEEGEATHPLRVADPPPNPPPPVCSTAASLPDRMRDVIASREWDELGLGDDPSEGAPVVRVARSEDEP